MPHIKNLDEKYIVGIETRTINEPGMAEKDIPETLKRFREEGIFEKITDKTNQNVIALYTDYEKDYTRPYTFVIGCEVHSLENIPEGLVGKKIPSSSFAVFDCKGKFPDSILNTWKEIWQSSMKRTYTGDFELYPANFNPASPETVQIYIAVES